LPLFYNDRPNKSPTSANPLNQVTTPLNFDDTETKFQLSLKTKVVEGVFGDIGDLWAGYTQTSRWQILNSDNSRPFRETNYEPEVSLIFPTNYNFFGLNGRLFGLTLNHQSNGRSSPLSRSWNRAILNIGFERENWVVMLRPWYRIPEAKSDDDNPDITNYLGNGDLQITRKWNNHEFSLMLRHSLKGGDKSHGAAQFDWSFPIKDNLRGFAQVFNGYGESMIDYNHRSTYYGLGISLLNWY
jgi:phospholipase A1